jgi:rhodanese-related sulfurtransferase
MNALTRFSLQTVAIVAISVGLGVSFNATRPGSLPLVYAQESQVQLDAETGEISLKDATLLFVSKRAVFLDARDADSFAEGHIEGALSMPPDYFGEDYPKFESQLTGKIVITYCDGERCHLSHDLADLLKARGVQEVFVLINGWTLWKNENLPTATGSDS